MTHGASTRRPQGDGNTRRTERDDSLQLQQPLCVHRALSADNAVTSGVTLSPDESDNTATHRASAGRPATRDGPVTGLLSPVSCEPFGVL